MYFLKVYINIYSFKGGFPFFPKAAFDFRVSAALFFKGFSREPRLGL